MLVGTKIAVQIVSYRTRRYLERCVETVVSDLEGSSMAFEINLLDNASGEDLSEVAARVPNCRAFTAPTNLGFGGGHNLLAGRTEAPFLLILNPDVEFLFPETVERLLLPVASVDRVKACGPKLLTAEGRPQPYDHGRLHGLRAAIALKGGHSYWRQTDTRQEVAWVSGAAALIERGAFLRVGGFDERLFLYKEDEDLCLRLREAGGQVIYEPAAAVRHHGSVVAEQHREIDVASKYYFSKHFQHQPSRQAFGLVHQILAYFRL
jgi:N-acetylglucosaminyl-diphospho-decaprenol L-rhamnosyltransferase